MFCTDFRSNELHKQMGMDRVMTSGSLGGTIVSTLTWNTIGVGTIPALGTIFPILIAPPTYRQVGMNRVMTSGSLGGIIVVWV